jgi:hypothetical protein
MPYVVWKISVQILFYDVWFSHVGEKSVMPSWLRIRQTERNLLKLGSKPTSSIIRAQDDKCSKFLRNITDFSPDPTSSQSMRQYLYKRLYYQPRCKKKEWMKAKASVKTRFELQINEVLLNYSRWLSMFRYKISGLKRVRLRKWQ